jgi:ribosomal protein S18 acetylase RimI-like enzyme
MTIRQHEAGGLTFFVDDADQSREADWIEAELGAHVASEFAPKDARALVISARAPHGTLVGGLVGLTHWRWTYIRQLWVAKACRGRGIGTRLIGAAIDESVIRGCHGLYVDTFSPQAVRFYRSNSFHIVGSIADFPPGHERVFLARPLDRPKREVNVNSMRSG